MKFYRILAVSLSMLCLIGCGNKERNEADKAAALSAKSFDQAPDPVKAQFQKVVSSIKSNDFASAKAALDELSKAQLTPEQDQAVADQRNELMIKLADAVQKGDANAGKMIQELRYQGRAPGR